MYRHEEFAEGTGSQFVLWSWKAVFNHAVYVTSPFNKQNTLVV